MSLRVVDSVLTGQALVVGRVADDLTGRAPAGPVDLSLEMRVAGRPRFHPFPVPPRLLSGGYFQYTGTPDQVFPAVEDPDTLELRLSVSVAGYDPAQVDFSLSASDLISVEEETTLGGHELTVPTYPGLPSVQDVALQPHPVDLAGWVIDDADPEIPVVDASARITAPAARGPVLSDDRGYFRIEDLPLALAVTVEITKDARTLTREVRIRTDEPLNQRTFSLPA